MTYGLEDDEELPADIEDLTEAQYTAYMMVQTLKGTISDKSVGRIMGEKPSGLVLPEG